MDVDCEFRLFGRWILVLWTLDFGWVEFGFWLYGRWILVVWTLALVMSNFNGHLLFQADRWRHQFHITCINFISKRTSE